MVELKQGYPLKFFSFEMLLFGIVKLFFKSMHSMLTFHISSDGRTWARAKSGYYGNTPYFGWDTRLSSLWTNINVLRPFVLFSNVQRRSSSEFFVFLSLFFVCVSRFRAASAPFLP